MKIFNIFILLLFLPYSVNCQSKEDKYAIREAKEFVKKISKKASEFKSYLDFVEEWKKSIESESSIPSPPEKYGATKFGNTLIQSLLTGIKENCIYPNSNFLIVLDEPNIKDDDLLKTRKDLKILKKELISIVDLYIIYNDLNINIEILQRTINIYLKDLYDISLELEKISKNLNVVPEFIVWLRLDIISMNELKNKLNRLISEKKKEFERFNNEFLENFRTNQNKQIFALVLEQKNIKAKTIFIGEEIVLLNDKIKSQHRALNNKRIPLNKKEEEIFQKWQLLNNRQEAFKTKVNSYNNQLILIKQDEIKLANFTFGKCLPNDIRNINKKDCCPQGNDLKRCISKAHEINRNNYYRNKKNFENSLKNARQKLSKENISIQQILLKLESDKNQFNEEYREFKFKRDKWITEYEQYKSFKKSIKQDIHNLKEQVDSLEILLNENNADLEFLKTFKIK